MTTNSYIINQNYLLIIKMTQNSVLDVGVYANNDKSELEILHPRLIEEFDSLDGKRIVDYGCGQGFLVEELADLGAKSIGYDISEEMIRLARMRLGDRAILETIQSGRMPLLNDSVDAVVSNLVLMMCQDKSTIEEIFRETQRVLKPNGKFVFCITHPCFVDKEFTTYRNIFSKALDYFTEGQQYQFVLRNANGREVTDESFRDYHYPLEFYVNALTASGFSLRKIREIQVAKDRFPAYLIINSTKEDKNE